MSAAGPLPRRSLPLGGTGAQRRRGTEMSAVPKTQLLLSSDGYRKIDRELAKFPAEQRRSAVIAALAVAQDELGWLSQEVIEEVAGYLNMPPIAVFEVATFYSMFNVKPLGRYKITLCTNLPCALSGATRAAHHLKQQLGIGFGDTTADGAVHAEGRRVPWRMR